MADLDEVLGRIDELAGEPLASTGKPASPEAVAKAKEIVQQAARLPLADQPYFDEAGLYRPGNGRVGFRLVEREHEPQHAWRPDSFYVQTANRTAGWVPWVGSLVVWPWQRAWQQDLHFKTVDADLRPSERKR